MNKNTNIGSGLGLDSIGDLSSLLNENPQNVAKQTGPLLLHIDQVVEDPDQPRSSNNPGFSRDSLNELAETVKLRGIKTPISVREIPGADNFMINHGARRYRAARIAGLTTIPAFIDNDYLITDQVIENIQRNDLTPREIANFIGRELAKGKKKGEIAKDIGKSPAFVKQHATLLDLPEPIAIIFNSDRVRDVTIINDLVTLFKKYPSQVEFWLDDPEQDISRGTVKLFREYLINKPSNTPPQGDDDNNTPPQGDDDNNTPPQGDDDNNTPPQGDDDNNTPPQGDDDSNTPPQGDDDSNTPPQGDDDNNTPPQSSRKKSGAGDNQIISDPGADKFKKAIVQVRHDDRLARLILTKRPQEAGFAWLKYDDDGQEFEADLNDVQLVAVIEG
jgi:ParB family chromosome partitioning protein